MSLPCFSAAARAARTASVRGNSPFALGSACSLRLVEEIFSQHDSCVGHRLRARPHLNSAYTEKIPYLLTQRKRCSIIAVDDDLRRAIIEIVGVPRELHAKTCRHEHR